MSAKQAGFELDALEEFAPDASFANQFPRAAKYINWPMLIVLSLCVQADR